MQVTVFLLVNKKVILFTVNPRYILTSWSQEVNTYSLNWSAEHLIVVFLREGFDLFSHQTSQ